ncbi:hypothetical protein NMG60_11023065 [Bertholletia excelsa]
MSYIMPIEYLINCTALDIFVLQKLLRNRKQELSSYDHCCPFVIFLLSSALLSGLFSIIYSFLYDRAGERRSTSSSTRHVVLAFLVSSLIGLLQLKYQNKSITHFDTHPMATCLTSLCAYCLANEAEAIAQKRRAKHHSRIPGQLALVLGALSSVLLASVFMSSVVARLFCVVWVVLLLAVLGIHLIQSIYQWLYQRTAMSVSWVLDLCTRLGRRLMQRQDFPV